MNLLQLEPESTLYFCKTPLQTSPNRNLKLTNNGSGYVAFKVKTTAPKAYLVRPSSGTLRPRESTEVQIILQPTGSDGQANNHRFLVQAVGVQSSEAVSREEWGSYPKESIQEQRLNVVLEEREDDAKPAASAGADSKKPDIADAPADLKQKYDELVQYVLMLEKEKKKLEDEAKNTVSQPVKASEGYSRFQVILVALIAFLLAYAAKFFK
jgi:hypothetical protein